MNIFFHINETTDFNILKTFEETDNAIESLEKEIHTYSIAHLSFDLLDLGYKIFIVNQDVCCVNSLDFDCGIDRAYFWCCYADKSV